MKFGVFDHVDGYDLPLTEYYEARLKLIEAYDRAGFHSYHIAEHHQTPLGMAASPSVFLAAVAQRTRTLRFGPLVYAAPLYHPLRLIEEICMLDQMSGGRLDIGFGRGASPIELAYFGTDPTQSQAIYTEMLELILQGLTSKTLTFSGEHFRFDDVPMELEPFQKPYPPVWYGVHSNEAAVRAGKRGLNMVSPDSVAQTQAYNAHYRSAWRETHGDAPTPLLGLTRFIYVADTDEEAMATASRAYLVWHASFTKLFRKHNKSQNHPQPADFATVHKIGRGIAGSPETVARLLRPQLIGAEVNYFAGQYAFGDLTLPETLRSLDLFTTEVIPALDLPPPRD